MRASECAAEVISSGGAQFGIVDNDLHGVGFVYYDIEHGFVEDELVFYDCEDNSDDDDDDVDQEEDSKTLMRCGICFDDVGTKEAAKLPCGCNNKQFFHQKCLEESMWRKTACPTCRANIKPTGYDPDTCRPIFSTASQDDSFSFNARSVNAAMSRHTKKFMENNIRDYNDNSKENDKPTEIKCVCGSNVKPMTLAERKHCTTRQFSCFICDICGERVPLTGTGYVWVCDNIDSMVHSLQGRGAFDICAKCVSSHKQQSHS